MSRPTTAFDLPRPNMCNTVLKGLSRALSQGGYQPRPLRHSSNPAHETRICHPRLSGANAAGYGSVGGSQLQNTGACDAAARIGPGSEPSGGVSAPADVALTVPRNARMIWV